VVAEGARKSGNRNLQRIRAVSKTAPRLGGIGDTSDRKLRIDRQRSALRGARTSSARRQPERFRPDARNEFRRVRGSRSGNVRPEKMVALQAGTVSAGAASVAIANIKNVSGDGQLVRTARDIGISFAAPKESKFKL
jgi:hypothetical protein